MSELMQYKDYLGSAEFSVEDEVFHGKLEFIRAHIDYEAESAKDLKKAFEDAVDLYLEVCEKKGIEPELPCKGKFNVRIAPEKHRNIAKLSFSLNQSLNSVLNDAIDLYITFHSSSPVSSFKDFGGNHWIPVSPKFEGKEGKFVQGQFTRFISDFGSGLKTPYRTFVADKSGKSSSKRTKKTRSSKIS